MEKTYEIEVVSIVTIEVDDKADPKKVINDIKCEFDTDNKYCKVISSSVHSGSFLNCHDRKLPLPPIPKG